MLHCPNCQGTDIVRHGKTRQGKQRSRCREKGCAGRTFLLAYAYAGQSPAVKQQSVDMAMNASGIRDTARVLAHQSEHGPSGIKKKAPALEQVHHAVWQVLPPEHVEVEMCRSEELDSRRGLTSELDERWSDVRSKANPRWL